MQNRSIIRRGGPERSCQTKLGLLTSLLLGALTLCADPPHAGTIGTIPAVAGPSLSVSSGVPVVLRVTGFAGTGPYTYHWQLNGKELADATLQANRLILASVTPADVGEYTVLVRNAEGEALGGPFTLQVDPTFVNVPLPAGTLFAGEWVDLNNDGWLDLSELQTAVPPAACTWRVLINSRDGGFLEGWQQHFVNAGTVYERGYGDYDNDGLPDVATGDDTSFPLMVFHNEGTGQLKQVWQGAGPYFHCEWADLDNDGYLDLVQLHPWGKATVWLNDHDGPPFHRVTQSNEAGWALSQVRESHYTAWGDYDNDGLLDVYVTGYTVPGQLFHNLGGGYFEKAGFQGPASPALDAAWVDYDGDGDLDLVINFYHLRPLEVYRNDGEGHLALMTAAEIGDLADDPIEHSCAMSWGDFDNDGDLDLYRVAALGPGLLDWVPQPGRLYVNQGGGRFVRTEAGSPTSGAYGYPYTACWGDYDNDGFLDLIGSKTAESSSPLYRNNLPNLGNANHWLKVRCEGRVSNRDAVGAKVRVTAVIGGEERWQLRQIVRPGSGGPLIAHFGLGDATQVEALRVEWPSGIVQELKEVAVNQSLVVKEPPRLVPTGPCAFEVKCWPGMHFTVEASTDLKTWTPVGQVLNVTGTATFGDAVGVHGACRFYRVVED